MKKLFSLITMVLISTILFAEDFSADGIYYKNLGGDSVATTYRGQTNGAYQNEYTGNITIPSTVSHNGKTYRVTSIGESTFFNCSIKSVIIPESITKIGQWAFEKCSLLTTINLPSTLRQIDNAAFYQSGIVYITIPSSIKTINQGVFCQCTNLTSVTIPNSVTSIGIDAFFGCSGLVSITIPNSVTTIANTAFCGCTHLFSIEIPNGVTTIGNESFDYCTNLISVTIGSDVTQIGDKAFSRCTKLTEITTMAIIPPIIAENTFKDVDHSIPLYVPAESVEDYKTAAYWKEFTNIRGISNNTTSISTILPTNAPVNNKVFINGTLYILRNEEIYTINGIRVM